MTPITRTIREQITDQLRNDVVAGQFPAGQPLRETDLASRFGVSRGPIRDAFLQLSQEGYLSYQANRGVTVSEPPLPENREFVVSLRQQIESHVIRRGLADLNNGSLRPVEDALQELKAACDAGDESRVARCDVRFHEAMLTACGGEDFLPIWKWLCSRMLLAYSRLETYQQVYEEHVAIYEALKSGKKQKSISAVSANIR